MQAFAKAHSHRCSCVPSQGKDAQDQSQPGLRWPKGRRLASRRARLARQLPALRSAITRRRNIETGATSKPLRAKSVTHVFGIIRNPCLRYGPRRAWLGRQDSNLGSRDQNPLPYRLATPQQRQNGRHHRHPAEAAQLADGVIPAQSRPAPAPSAGTSSASPTKPAFPRRLKPLLLGPHHDRRTIQSR